jgi:hypothetical protein
MPGKHLCLSFIVFVINCERAACQNSSSCGAAASSAADAADAKNLSGGRHIFLMTPFWEQLKRPRIKEAPKRRTSAAKHQTRHILFCRSSYLYTDRVSLLNNFETSRLYNYGQEKR